MNISLSESDVRKLHAVISQAVGQVGIKNPTLIIIGLDGKTFVNHKMNLHPRELSRLLVSRCITIFSLLQEEFHTSEETNYRDARMLCYYLLHNNTHFSYRLIAEHFGRSKRQVLYYCNKCKEMIELSQFHKELMKKYKDLEALTLEFLLKK